MTWGIFHRAILSYALLTSYVFHSSHNAATDSPGLKVLNQPSVKWQKMLQMTLKTASLQEDQEIWNLTFQRSVFFL